MPQRTARLGGQVQGAFRSRRTACGARGHAQQRRRMPRGRGERGTRLPRAAAALPRRPAQSGSQKDAAHRRGGVRSGTRSSAVRRCGLCRPRHLRYRYCYGLVRTAAVGAGRPPAAVWCRSPITASASSMRWVPCVDLSVGRPLHLAVADLLGAVPSLLRHAHQRPGSIGAALHEASSDATLNRALIEDGGVVFDFSDRAADEAASSRSASCRSSSPSSDADGLRPPRRRHRQRISASRYSGVSPAPLFIAKLAVPGTSGLFHELGRISHSGSR